MDFELLLLALLIWACTKIQFLFEPIGTFISTLFAPILIAGFLFYLLNPLVNLLMKIKVKIIMFQELLQLQLFSCC